MANNIGDVFSYDDLLPGGRRQNTLPQMKVGEWPAQAPAPPKPPTFPQAAPTQPQAKPPTQPLQQKQAPAQPEAPKAPAQPEAPQSPADAHFGAQQSMIGDINNAMSKEMDSRVEQQREARQQEHERWMASMDSMKGSAPQQAPAKPDHTEFNNTLMRMAGLGGRTVVSDNNGLRVSNGPFGHIANALRG